MAEAPLLFDRYRIVRKLGSGAFATVYLADDETMGRSVAIKVIEDVADIDGRALREVQAAAKLDHPHIVTVYEVARESDRTLLFTEYAEGSTLRALFARRRLPDADLLEAGIQIARALEHAHGRGVVHRDIKPENIMLIDGDRVDVRVMDFGVARLEDLTSITLDGDLVGTLSYMAHEQLEGRPTDRTVDVYALAVTLYEGFSGANPLRGKDPATVIREAGKVEFPPLARSRPDLPPALGEALRRGLERNPQLRPSSVDFRRLLERVARDLPEPVEKEGGRGRRRLAAAAARFGGTERAAFVGRHLVAGALSLAAAGYLLPRIPFYPESWVVPLAAVAAFVSLLSPVLGGILTLGVLAPPAFGYGLGWGVTYLVAASLIFGLPAWRRHGWAALLPAAMPALAALGVGLAVPVAAGFLLRRWGPFSAFAAGLALAAAAGFEGWSMLPYTFSTGAGPALEASRHAASPGAAVEALARFLDSRPELLLQAVLFALLAVPLARFLTKSMVRRLWVACTYLAVVYAAFVLAPPLVVGVGVGLGRFALAYVPCVIIVVLSALLVPVEGRSPAAED